MFSYDQVKMQKNVETNSIEAFEGLRVGSHKKPKLNLSGKTPSGLKFAKTALFTLKPEKM